MSSRRKKKKKIQAISASPQASFATVNIGADTEGRISDGLEVSRMLR